MKAIYDKYVHEYVDKKGVTRYGVAEWNEETGQYTRPLSKSDQELTGCSAEFGNKRIFSSGYWGGYLSRRDAMRRARYLFGGDVAQDAEFEEQEPEVYDSQCVLEAENRRDFRLRYPWAEKHYGFIMRVEGGYHCFEFEDDYRTFKNQK